jgi:hypothetical protein
MARVDFALFAAAFAARTFAIIFRIFLQSHCSGSKDLEELRKQWKEHFFEKSIAKNSMEKLEIY